MRARTKACRVSTVMPGERACMRRAESVHVAEG